MENTLRSFRKIQQSISSGEQSLVEIVNLYLKNIENGKDLNAFLEVFGEEALEKAAEIQQKIQDGKAGKLAGMVVGIKDNICYKGHAVSASSLILKGFESLYSATAVQRLIDEDAIIIGRLNCDEFAMGSANESSYYGPAKNPVDPTRVPGGSSGGSAAAVAAEMCTVALGSDTGGSIRQPAGFCGVVGLKPTYGRVSRYGLLAYGSSFDQIGPIANNVEDAALTLEVMSGHDGQDSTSSQREVPAYSQISEEKKTYKIAVLKEGYESEGLHADVKKAFDTLVDKLKAEGHTVEMVDFDLLNKIVPAYYVLTTAEASSNLSRYDGIHYGYRSGQADNLETTYKLSRSEGFGKEVKRRIMLGTFVLSSGYYDAYYSKAQKVRRLIQDATAEILKEYDFILTPTAPGPAFEIGNKNDDPTAVYLEDIFTVQANMVGMPAISLPIAETESGLPLGFQLLTDQFAEEKLLQMSAQVLNWSAQEEKLV